MKKAILPILVLLVIAGAFVVYAYESSPYTSSPSVSDVRDDGTCNCRWRGDCKKIGDKCYNCIDDLKYNHSLGKCYSCIEGTSLKQKKSGQWVCSNE